ncbi:MAG TPA: class I SAM-dependent methyltransferase [Thermoanaerobaculia bacterium]|jgi:2-polyprenyl-3-methyl-5-hydroxy-6-metoxy-1,4-benzoquinol methylase
MNKTDFVRSEEAYLSPAVQQLLFSLPGRCKFLIDHAGPPPRRVLDVGCASGYIALLLQKLGHQVTGIELNARLAGEARARGIAVLEHDLEEPLPLLEESMDVVHACEILEHLFDTEGFLSELHRVLVPGGTLILSTPNLNSLGNRLRVLLGRPLPMWGAFPKDQHGGHIRVFNRAKVDQLLQRTGFLPEVVVGMNQSSWHVLLDSFPSLSEMLLVKARRL